MASNYAVSANQTGTSGKPQVGGNKFKPLVAEKENIPLTSPNEKALQPTQMRATSASAWVRETDSVKLSDSDKKDQAPELQFETALDKGIHAVGSAVGAVLTGAAIIWTGETPQGRAASQYSDQALPSLTTEQEEIANAHTAAYAAVKNAGHNEGTKGVFSRAYEAVKNRVDAAFTREHALGSGVSHAHLTQKIKERTFKEQQAIDDGILAALETKEQLETGLA
ncbi:MAG: hypothetical protein WC901_03050 [Candidatus Margulisiibacteriota bacterium]